MLQVGEAIRVDAVEERARLRPGDEDLPERRDVDQADAAVHALSLRTGVGPVRVRPPPGAGPHHRAARVLVPVVQRGALGRLVRRPCEQPERHGRVRRARRRRADRVLVEAGRLRVDADRVDVAEATLARAHGHGRVALGELDRVEALGDRVAQVLDALVLAEADEALVAVAAEHRLGHGGLADVTRHRAGGVHVRRQVGRHEDPARGVELDACAGLREELVVRLRAATHHEQVALHGAHVELDARHVTLVPDRRHDRRRRAAGSRRPRRPGHPPPRDPRPPGARGRPRSGRRRARPA